MKAPQTLFAFAAGLVVGIGAMLAVDALTGPDPETVSEQGGTATLPPRSKQATDNQQEASGGSRGKLQSLGDRPKVVKASDGSNDEEAADPIEYALQSTGIELPDDFMEKIRERQKLQEQKQINARVAALRDRLGLGPEQQAKIKALLEARNERKMAMVNAALKAAKNRKDGPDSDSLNDLMSSLSPRKPIDQEIREHLDEEQLAAYEEYREERRQNQIEVAANRRLTELQGMFTLTEEQKDAAYEVFSRQAEQQASMQSSLDLGHTSMIMPARGDNEPLRDILTEEQFEAYDARSSSMIFTAGEGGSRLGTTTTIMLDSVDLGDRGAVFPAPGSGVESRVEVIEVEEP